MNADEFAEWQRRQGYKVIRTQSCYWYNVMPGFYFNIPYHRLITPSKDELDRLLWETPSFGVRYFTPMDCYGKSSYMIVCSDKNYDLNCVDAKYARRQTRRGLEHFQVRQVDFEELASHNHNNTDTLIRQGRQPHVWTEKKWRLFCSSTVNTKDIEAWGAFRDNDLGAFLVAYQIDDYFYILHQSSATKYLTMYPNNALVYSVTKLKLASSNINHISYGPQSLDAPGSLETFKFRMGFQKLLMKQAISFHKFIRPFINNTSYNLIHSIAQSSSKEFWRKLEGVLSFYKEMC
jgi:hypothetical protein